MTTVSSPPRALEGRTPVSRGKVLSWAMWDWGNQPFNSVITTFVFSVYLTSAAFGDTNFTSQALAVSTALTGIIVALLAPVQGQNADRTGRPITYLKWMTWAVAAISALMFFVAPDAGRPITVPWFGGGVQVPAMLLLGLVLLGVGSIFNEIAGVLYNSLIDQVATESNVGRVSGFGWGMGYLGGIVSLLILYFGLIQPEVGLFGVSNAGAMDIRVSMVICAIWMVVFTIPTFVALRDTGEQHPSVGIVTSYRLLGRSIAKLWRSDRNVLYFLGASALFRDGLNGIFAFGAIIAAGTFGFSAGQVIVFGVVANLVAGVSTILMGLLDDRFGPKRVIMVSLSALTVFGIAVFALHDRGPIVFWTFGLAMCAFVGPAQAASRSFLARLVPEGRSGEIFGLYATTGRVVSALSPAMFGLAIALGAAVTGGANTQYWGILGIALILLAGLLVMIPVREEYRGIE